MCRRGGQAICLSCNPLPREWESTVEGVGMRGRGRIAAEGGTLALAAAVAMGAAPSKKARWPLDLPPVLTSTFGEYRPQHLHAGIDLATGGHIGAPCYAVGDGSIVRLRMSPYGYGKALYLQLDSGPLVVYAHLSRFAPAPAARARAEQESQGRYTFDLNLPPAQLRVRRGEVVAWSGQTGVGVPHLHFELRDGDVARNPQTAGFAVADAVAPTIEDVTVHPLDAGSHVEGESVPKRIPASGAPLRAGGRLAFSVRTWDAAAPDGHRQGPYRLELRVDDAVLYRSTAERFDYATNHLLVVEYDQERLTQDKERALWLWRRPGNRLLGREDPAGTAGVLNAPALAGPRAPGFQPSPGPHAVEVEVADVAGNTTVRRFQVVVGARPAIAMLHGRDDGDALRVECRVLDADLLARGASVAESLGVLLDGSRDGGTSWQPLVAERAGSDHRGLWRWTAAWPGGGNGDVVVRARARDRSGLEATRTWTAGARHEAEGELAIQVHPRWRAHGLEVDLEAADLLEAAPSVYVLRSDGGRDPLACVQRGARAYRASGTMAALAPGVDAIEVQARALDGRRASFRHPLRSRIVRRGERARVRDLDPRLDVEIGAGAALDDIALRIAPAPVVDLGLELRPAGTAFMLEPRAAAFDDAVRVSVLPVDGEKDAAGGGLGLFSVDRSGSLRFLSAERDAAGALTAETRFLGALLLLRDATAPAIGALRVVARQPARLAFTVLDRGADLGDGGITAMLDGKVAIPEWDPETGAVTIEPAVALATGTHTLQVIATDRVGNRAERRFTFDIPDRGAHRGTKR